jgi:hypothetical protein
MADRDLCRDAKERWLNLADNYLRSSGNDFLERFCDFLEEGYKDSEQRNRFFNEPSWADDQQILLKEMLDFDTFRGCFYAG